MNLSELKEQYNIVCEMYLQAFCNKHGLYYEENSWVGNEVGTISMIADYYINFNDIRYDIDEDISSECWEDWYDYCIDWGMIDSNHNINFKSWCNGCPRRSFEDYNKALKMHNKVLQAQAELEKCLNEI